MTQTADAKTARLLDWLRPAKLMPVLSIPDVDTGLRLVDTLCEAGLSVLEVTLRTDAALLALKAIAQRMPDVVLAAGTVRNGQQLHQVAEAGAHFAVSPGASLALLAAAAKSALPFMPGIGTVSEAMSAQDYGFRVLKLFPAEVIGGVKWLKSVHAPLPDLKFCPTGGISAASASSYLALPNVVAIGGSWMVPEALVSQGKWAEIGALAREAAGLVRAGA